MYAIILVHTITCCAILREKQPLSMSPSTVGLVNELFIGNTSENGQSNTPRPSVFFNIATDCVTCGYLKWRLMYSRLPSIKFAQGHPLNLSVRMVHGSLPELGERVLRTP